MASYTLIDNSNGQIISNDFKIEIEDIKNNRVSKNNKLKGVYKITYLPTNQVYIGSSKYIQRRWKEHKKDLQDNNHHSWKLQKAWNNEEDKNKFTFEILEIVNEIHLLFEREQYWINFYNSASNENFNMLKEAGMVFVQSSRDKFNSMQKDVCGNFIFFNVEKLQELNEILTEYDLVKFFFMCTYINNDNILVLDNNKTPIDEIKLKEFLDFKDRKNYSEFLNKLTTNKLIHRENGLIQINKNYFFKGANTNKDIKNIIRIYVKQARQIYNTTDKKVYRVLSLIFKIIPYINYKYNILCDNPDECLKDEIKTISLSQVMNKLGRDVSQASRTFKNLSAIKINNEDIIKIIKDDDIIKKPYLIINPRLFYKYNNAEEMKSLIDIFNIDNK